MGEEQLMRLGYIGLGNIGAPMAQCLVKSGAAVTVFDVAPQAAAPFASAATVAASPAQVGANADLVGICARHDTDVIEIVAGAGGLLETMTAGGIAIHSTVRPSTVKALAETAAAKGVVVIDAAVTGGADVAARGELTIMAGGAPEDVALLRPLMEPYSKAIIHAGALGAGMTLKLSNNLVTYMQLAAAVEGYRLAEAAGLDPAQLTEVMTNNGNLTPTMGAYIKGRKVWPEALGPERYRQSQLSLVDLAKKDMSLAEEVAAELGVALPGTTAIRTLFSDLILGSETHG